MTRAIKLYRSQPIVDPYSTVDPSVIDRLYRNTPPIAVWNASDLPALVPPDLPGTHKKGADTTVHFTDTTALPGKRYYYVAASCPDANHTPIENPLNPGTSDPVTSCRVSRFEAGHAGTLIIPNPPAARPLPAGPLPVTAPVLALSGALTLEGAIVWEGGVLRAGPAAAPALEAIRAANPALNDAQIRTILTRSTSPLAPSACPGTPAPGFGWLDPAQAIALATHWKTTLP